MLLVQPDDAGARGPIPPAYEPFLAVSLVAADSIANATALAAAAAGTSFSPESVTWAASGFCKKGGKLKF